MVLHTCLYLVRCLVDRPWQVPVGKLMNQGIRMLLLLVDRGRSLSTMRFCSIILGQPSCNLESQFWFAYCVRKPVSEILFLINFGLSFNLIVFKDAPT